MRFERDASEVWRYAEKVPPKWDPVYAEALLRYLNIFDVVFARAKAASEFEFLLALFRVRGLQDPGWDSYETSIRAVKSISQLHNEIHDFETQRHLDLWLYGHIVEAAELYEMIANLIDISQGGRFQVKRFPDHRNGRPQTPGEKIQKIKTMATTAGMEDLTVPLQEVWNRNLRNAIFHSDYTLHGMEVRLVAAGQSLSETEVSTLLNRALAYFEVLRELYIASIGDYKKPVIIDVHPEFSGDPEEKAVVIVRKGHGAVGLKDNWSPEELQKGKVPFLIGRLYPEESQLLGKEPTRCLLPRREK